MKHIYLQPQISITEVSASRMIAESKLGVSNGEVTKSSSIGFVKGETSQSNYNVWEDDWSNE